MLNAEVVPSVVTAEGIGFADLRNTGVFRARARGERFAFVANVVRAGCRLRLRLRLRLRVGDRSRYRRECCRHVAVDWAETRTLGNREVVGRHRLWEFEDAKVACDGSVERRNLQGVFNKSWRAEVGASRGVGVDRRVVSALGEKVVL